MKRFLAGIVVGAMLAVSISFLSMPAMQYYTGSFLNEDIVCLKGGFLIRGWIERENDDVISIRTKTDSLSVPRSKCKAIYKNAPLYYIRKLM